jgi:hypothetical protein
VLGANEPSGIFVRDACHKARQPAYARAIAVKAEAGDAEPDIDPGLERLRNQRLASDEGLHHGVAVACRA